MISVYNIHHSPAVWDDAEAFQPERFSLDTPTPNEQNTDYRSAILAAQVHLMPAKLCVFKAERVECNAPTLPMMAQVVVVILNQSACVLDRFLQESKHSRSQWFHASSSMQDMA